MFALKERKVIYIIAKIPQMSYNMYIPIERIRIYARKISV